MLNKTMGLDSIEIVMGWEESFGIAIADADAMSLRTPLQAMGLISAKLTLRDETHRTCLTLRAFHRLRQAIVSATGIRRDQVRPDAKLRNLVKPDRRCTWDAVRARSGIVSLPNLGWFAPRTVNDLMYWVIAHAAKDLKRPYESWTPSEIRSVVRAVITDVTGVVDFLDTDDFVRDIGID